MPKPRSIIDALENTQNQGIALCFFVIAMLTQLDFYSNLFEKDRLLFTLIMLLMCSTFALCVLYLISARTDADLMALHLDEEAAPKKVSYGAHLAILGLAGFLGFLIVAAKWLLVFSLLYAVYTLIDMWGNWQWTQGLKSAFQARLRSPLSESERLSVEAIRDFFLENPFIPKTVILMFFSLLIFAVCVENRHVNNMYVTYAAYAAQSLILIGNEVVMFYWRRRRDILLAKAEQLGNQSA